ncbi:MAG: hypothetical protein CL807_06450 [Citromicrobium sp.]|nr:hypothetical protein [Citromicrobium sp.]MAO96553.1 hypothetical protein [Citromicrobium sp.]MBD76519.1 hypothetical protein [Citromicrobium sp.]MBT47685.1 hypothetical protein [Citromicrobium sp.]|tara:strand:- start:1502 stop:2152 length:651 start_codon:yes stop_codon:yes gene_type:complete
MPSLVIVTTGAATNGGATDAWRAVRSDSDLQFAPIAPPDPPQTPEWLRAVGEILNSIFGPVAHAIAAAWPVLQWVLVAIGVALLIMLVVRILGLDVFKRRDVVEEAEVDLAPDRAEAQALLSDADALAAQGRYGEAVRLLLARSIGQISSRRPDLVHPSSTARELGRLDALPEKARRAFIAIARSVERALFALEDLSESDWHEARSAYADFALERG